MKVRFAASLGAGAPDLDQLASSAIEAEKLGFDGVWFSDLPMSKSVDPMLAVAVAAASTSKVHLGANFVPFGMTPFMFARRMAHLDRLSSRRLLVTLVPGVDQPGEREALGIGKAHRGRLMDGLIPRLRELWAEGGEGAIPAVPLQQPLEIWLGGSGPEAIVRAGVLADGWLGSLVSPERAGAIREEIVAEATAAGREIDPEHFGLSIAYARQPADFDRAVRFRSRPVDLENIVPVGEQALRELVARLLEEGLSKFVVRRIAGPESWSEELQWMAGALLDLQT